MMRLFRVAVAAMLATGLLAAAGCTPEVEVRTGTKTVCTYGEVVSDDIRTIKVPADEAGKYNVRTVAVTCDKHTELEKVYGEAQDALEAGDLTTAQKKLEAVVAIEAGFGKATAQLSEIAAGKKPAPDRSAPGGSVSPPSEPAEKPGESSTGVPAESLLRWAPDELTGFTGSKPAVDTLNVARQYVPTEESKVVTFVITAEQFSSAKMAKDGLTAQVKNAYTRDKGSAKINGHDVYFGTDGQRFAAAAFVDGSVLVALEMSGKVGDSPAQLKAALESAIKQLP